MLRGLREAKAWADGESVPVCTTDVYPVDVRRIRERTGLSQAEFAEKFGFSLDAIQNWEQGRRVPERSARILLTIVDRNPEVVEAMLVAAG
jgi:putative transcriptional regulator